MPLIFPPFLSSLRYSKYTIFTLASVENTVWLFQVKWEGEYECQARHANGDVISSAKVNLALPTSASTGKVVVKVQGPTVRVVTEGESVSFTCQVPGKLNRQLGKEKYE